MTAILIPALLPVVILLRYVYKKDSHEKEPIGMVLKVAFFGAIFSFIDIPLESLAEGIISQYYAPDTNEFLLRENFLGVALIEELTKWVVLIFFVWKSPDFDWSYDGIVYAVTSSLGFAGMENILYLMTYGPGISFARAIFSIPGHAAFGVFMGYYLARAKDAALRNNSFGKTWNMILCILIPTLIHGYYDFKLSIPDEDSSTLTFLLYVIFIDITSWLLIKHAFKTDAPLGEDAPEQNSSI